MNGKYYVNFSNFEEYKKTFEVKISNFREELFHVFKYNQEVKWTGEGYDAVSNSISLEISKLDVIPTVLDLYVDFMDKALNNYSEGMEEIKKNFQDILERIMAEKQKRGELTDGI